MSADYTIYNGNEGEAAITQIRKNNHKECVEGSIPTNHGESLRHGEPHEKGDVVPLLKHKPHVVTNCEYDEHIDVQFMRNGERRVRCEHEGIPQEANGRSNDDAALLDVEVDTVYP